MPATPAWPPGSLPRLFIDTALAIDEEIVIDAAQASYLVRVLRLKAGAQVKLFDNRTGEWLAEIAHIGKRDAILRVEGKLRERDDVPDLWLCFAPIKKGRIDWLVEKACELGVARMVPVRTQRTIVDKLKQERLKAHLIEAAEQCERTALPELSELTPLAALLSDWPEDRTLFYAAERGGDSFRAALVAHDGPAAILIGPEGGFTDDEDRAIRALPQTAPVSLGPRILRADTAAAAAISLWMAGRGDWN
ncbi:16S rRNA (uracil(1498)-N(3))-methyltransferase [Parasphingopyxis lamellibrachiae]|uniref:Ribosomal RNA small subunit methyltransferase E n=1 Tax=Parasphingopyxis lamellibrachiae TaxID=680125 RepID=A0A3D9FGL9_9SPHN|nr:16S rRNA (uracil(1498)-N(3))-methyltransferase [Parasphingopyxis lamellibrachiae]RED16261.1 16S rRNA (uracil1498-N3)-methyltransferase [Parasphingopyxis lamellibrachiae]